MAAAVVRFRRRSQFSPAVVAMQEGSIRKHKENIGNKQEKGKPLVLQKQNCRPANIKAKGEKQQTNTQTNKQTNEQTQTNINKQTQTNKGTMEQGSKAARKTIRTTRK